MRRIFFPSPKSINLYMYELSGLPRCSACSQSHLSNSKQEEVNLITHIRYMMAFRVYYSLFLAIIFLSNSPRLGFCTNDTASSAAGATSTDGFSTDDANLDAVPSSVTVSQFVSAHNAARKVVGVPPLTWDAKLATFARAYARQRRGDCDLVHSPGYAYGENIFWGQGQGWTATDVVAAWVAEKQWYHYDSNSCSGPDCTHYTQIVWRTTQKMGCAKIICNSGDTWAACEYYPPGNYIGARPYIVPKP